MAYFSVASTAFVSDSQNLFHGSPQASAIISEEGNLHLFPKRPCRPSLSSYNIMVSPSFLFEYEQTPRGIGPPTFDPVRDHVAPGPFHSPEAKCTGDWFYHASAFCSASEVLGPVDLSTSSPGLIRNLLLFLQAVRRPLGLIKICPKILNVFSNHTLYVSMRASHHRLVGFDTNPTFPFPRSSPSTATGAFSSGTKSNNWPT